MSTDSKNQIVLDWVKQQLQEFTLEEIQQLELAVHENLMERVEPIAGSQYDEWRVRFMSQYTLTQVQSLKQWKNLSEKTRKRFTASYSQAQSYLRRLGFPTDKTLNIIRSLIVTNTELKSNKLSVSNMADNLDDIKLLFEKAFPQYQWNTDTLKFMRDNL